VPPLHGGADFRIGVRDGLGGARAWLAVSLAECTGAPVRGMPLLHAAPFRLVGTPNASGEGYGTVHLTLAANSALAGREFHARGFVQDAAASGGFAATRGHVFRIL
jgi:hypothetical protein